MLDCGFEIASTSMLHWISNSIDGTNRVNSKPVHFERNSNWAEIPPGAGQILVANCTNTLIDGYTISGTCNGMLVIGEVRPSRRDLTTIYVFFGVNIGIAFRGNVE